MDTLENPFRETITDSQLAGWLEQFEEPERAIIHRLLHYFEYFGPSRIFKLLKELHARLLNVYDLNVNRSWFVPFGYVAKSGSAVAYFYKHQNEVPQGRFVASESLNQLDLSDSDAVIFLDDFIGSGHVAAQLWDNVVRHIQERAPKCTFILACIAGYEDGIMHVGKSTGFDVVVAHELTNSLRPLSEKSEVFSTAPERQRAKEVLSKYGQRLAPKAPLGYADTQGLVGFFYSTPNNTLPIFWSAQDGWRPLLPRGESLRDPHSFLKAPPGLTQGKLPGGSDRALAELQSADEFEIPHEMSMALLEEFQSLRIVLVLARAFQDLNTPAPVLKQLLSLFHQLENFKHEQHSVCTALLLLPESEGDAVQGRTFVRADKNTTIADSSVIKFLANAVNGFDGAIAIDSTGHVLGNVMYEGEVGAPNPLLPLRYGRPAAATTKLKGMLALFLGDNRIGLFYGGDRILSRRNAAWHVHAALSRTIREIEEMHALDHGVFESVLRIAFYMADAGEGGMFTVGDAQSVLKISDKPTTGGLTWHLPTIQSMAATSIINLARQDGATIIGSDGKVVQGATFLRPPAGTSGDEEVGRGSKHSTAAKVSSATTAVVVAVSVDGRVSVYSEGRLVFKMMG